MRTFILATVFIVLAVGLIPTGPNAQSRGSSAQSNGGLAPDLSRGRVPRCAVRGGGDKSCSGYNQRSAEENWKLYKSGNKGR
jgi:hypothetical protein